MVSMSGLLIKINGVIKQCIVQSTLAHIPTRSDFLEAKLIIIEYFVLVVNLKLMLGYALVQALQIPSNEIDTCWI